MHKFRFKTFECNLGTMSAFPFSFWVFFLSGVVWYALVCTVLKYCDMYFVLHQSTNWPFPSCFSCLRGHVVAQASPELPSNNEDKALYLSFMPVDSDNPEIHPCFCGEAKVLKPPAAVMQCFLLSRTEIRGSTWIPFLFCIQSLCRVTVPTENDSVYYSSVRALKSPECASQARKRLAHGSLSWKLDLKYFSSEE